MPPGAARRGTRRMGAGLDPSPSFGGCSDPVSVELSMGGDYYRACCGEPDPDIPEGPKLPCVGDKVREGGRASPLSPTILTCPRSGIG